MESIAQNVVIGRTFPEEYLEHQIALIVEHIGTLGHGVDRSNKSSNCQNFCSNLLKESSVGDVVIGLTSPEEYLAHQIALIVEHIGTLGQGVDCSNQSSNCRNYFSN